MSEQSEKKSRVRLLFLLSILTIFLIVFLRLSFHNEFQSFLISLNPPTVFSGPNMPAAKVIASAGAIAIYVHDAIKQKKITLADFESLDFRLGQAEHGWSPKHKVASGQDRPNYGLFPANVRSTLKETIAAISEHEDSKPLINLRRSTDKNGLTIDMLYLIIPEIKEEACDEYYQYTGRLGKKLSSTSVKIAPDNHEIVVDEPRLSTSGDCILGDDDALYLLSPIIFRIRATEQSQWELGTERALRKWRWD